MSFIQRNASALALVAVMLLSVPFVVTICDYDTDAANATDVAWNDKESVISDTFLIAGQNTVGYGQEYVTITFDSNGGPAVDSMTIEAGTVPTLPQPTWSGHAFEGWYDSDSGELYEDTPLYYDITLYASWATVESHSYGFQIGGIYWAIIVIAAILIIGFVVVKRHR